MPALVNRLATRPRVPHTPAQAALNGVSLQAHPAQVFVLAGQSGTANSTIVNLPLLPYYPRHRRLLTPVFVLLDYAHPLLTLPPPLVPPVRPLFAVLLRHHTPHPPTGAFPCHL